MIVCIHGRTAADPLRTVECLDCEELAALRALERYSRQVVEWHNAPIHPHLAKPMNDLDDIRRRMGIGALGHPETRCTCPKRYPDIIEETCPVHGAGE